MTESRSVFDLVDILMKEGGLSPGDSLRVARLIDETFGLSTRGRGTTDAQRERWRTKKARQRARVPGDSPPEVIISKDSKTLSDSKKKKRAEVSPGDNSADDGWPADYLDQFWKAFPPYRRESKNKIGEKLERIRKNGDKAGNRVTWAQIIGAVQRYAATDPGKFAVAPIVWLNGEKWDREYGDIAAAAAAGGGAKNAGTSDNGLRGADAVLAAARSRVGRAPEPDGLAARADQMVAVPGRRTDGGGA